MIIKNEAELLPNFLRHAEGLYDEICVIDTGSTDRSVSILDAAGARVAHRAWDSDFAAARNASLDMARGEWILYLDPDEFVSPQLHDEVRQILGNDQIGAATLRFRNPLPNGHIHEARLLRMFRNDPSIRFVHRIHEDATDSIVASLRERGQKIVGLNASVLHVGYDKRHAAKRNKKDRDLQLLRLAVQDDPRDFYARYRMLDLARFWNDKSLWKSLALAEQKNLNSSDSHLLNFLLTINGAEYIGLIADGAFDREPKGTLQFITSWLPYLAPSAGIEMRCGEMCELIDRFEQAATHYLRSTQMEKTTRNLQIATTRPLMGLARIELSRNNPSAAIQWVNAALETNPRDIEACLSAIGLHRILGGDSSVKVFVAQHERANGQTEELQHALGEDALIRRSPSEAVEHFSKATGNAPHGMAGIRYAQSLLANGQLAQVREVARQLSQEIPEASLGILVCDLIEGRDTNLTLDMEPEDADKALRSWLSMLQQPSATNTLNREMFRCNASAVAALFPCVSEI